MKNLFAFVSACALALSLAACSNGSGSTSTPNSGKTSSDKFPNETITLVCPFSAGGGTDIGARNMATALAADLGINVVVENQTGSGGWVAWTDLITGDYDDGYTIGLINHNFVFGELDPENPRQYNLEDVQVLCNQVVDYDVLAIRANETRQIQPHLNFRSGHRHHRWRGHQGRVVQQDLRNADHRYPGGRRIGQPGYVPGWRHRHPLRLHLRCKQLLPER